MKTKHTQGKWTAHKLQNGSIVIKEKGLFEKGYSDRIAELHEYPQNIEANAKLIASAPDLLQTLIELREYLNPDEYAHKDGIIEKIDNAIKKATE